ncbi:phospho-N-acetylmuramoyl-pentapeptide-transferase [Oenococcus oeni]|uniref:phospho-N-acetylmuramoyl-pentapeptide- transferase n=1 Tax=Oenococcus oeni TaxID=1247 RepID=UPI000952C6D9|nr:phospho-N-acetylmuramoyl-pentapeptide-transferase [Oenococcus oeni]OLQ40291.1 phospho-N-acetylmuramoyl-pentapeptide-transferase [Oenococcus oeni]
MIFQIFSALLIGFLIAFAAIPFLIGYLTSRGEVGVERSGKRGFGVDTSGKNGTPSMGGVALILSSLFATLIVMFLFRLDSLNIIFFIVSFLSFGLIGLIDDALKVFYHRDEGFRFIPKLIAQIISAALITIILVAVHIPDKLTFPFFRALPLYFLVQFIFYLVWFVGWSNAANFVDGIDGLLAGIALLIFAGYGIIGIKENQNLMVIFDFSVVGSLLAYFIFNRPKAKIFMGDCGSMALGAGMAINAIFLQHPWSLLWFGLILALDTISVMIQVLVYHFFHVRVFPVAPLQHSFQRAGWSEWKIDSLFWTIQLIITVIGVFVWIK